MKKEKVLTPEEAKRKTVLNHRMFWLLVAIDLILIVGLVIQFIILFTK